MEEQKKPFYRRWWVWVIGVFVLGVIVSSSSDSKPAAPQTTAQVEQAATQPQTKQITYQIVDRWTIPNGGEGKVVVISPDLLNETDMIALGNKLKSDTQNDRNAFSSVFDNTSAAALRD